MTKITQTLGLTMKLSLVLYLLFSWPEPACKADMVTKYRIHVIDRLPDPNSTLFVHCKSGDSDKGGRQMKPGDDYSWGTRINFWSSTLYFCFVKWEGVKEKYFIAFKANRDHYRCKHMKACLWEVRDNGIFFSNNNVTWVNQFPW